MGLGCNAVGVTGCRIIDSPRERRIALLTNSLMPCNGRFPALLALTGAFICADSSLAGAAVLSACIVISVLATFVVSRLLASVFLRGSRSSFTLELPPFRAPRVLRVIAVSIKEKTCHILGRALCVAAPGGLLLWLLANISFSGTTALAAISGFLDPFGMLIGVDGAMIAALIFGLPANEIVIPIALMCYSSCGSLQPYGSSTALGDILTSNGWTISTALCAMVLILFHSPCATTLMTVKKETGSARAVLYSAIIPIALGVLISFAISFISRMC